VQILTTRNKREKESLGFSFKSAIKKLELTKQLKILQVKIKETNYKFKPETDTYELKKKELSEIITNDKGFLALCKSEIRKGQVYID
jgi:hypothetical protein